MNTDPISSAAAIVLACLLMTGCGQKKDDWYEYSSEVDRQERDFVRQNMLVSGMSEVEAKKAFDLHRSIMQTEGREEIIVDLHK